MARCTDLLSKWVGEAERKLKNLFDEAERMQPSIIFFDELDGLAPERSTKNEQANVSLVSTLLVLMDGIKPRGKVVLIGATNRIDAIDSALRRPGRFDRELRFDLPTREARRVILGIHARKLPLEASLTLLDDVAAACRGYCGADIKSLCAETSMAAMQRCCPHIYTSDLKLAVDHPALIVTRQDFAAAYRKVVPASRRYLSTPAQPLPAWAAPLLAGKLHALLARLSTLLPAAAAYLAAYAASQDPATDAAPDPLHPLDPSHPSTARYSQQQQQLSHRLYSGLAQRMSGPLAPDAAARSPPSRPIMSSPFLLLCGPGGNGQLQLACALMHVLEETTVHNLSLGALLGDTKSRSPEELLRHAVREAGRAAPAPAIIFLPDIDEWWATVKPHMRSQLKSLLAELPKDFPLLVLATAGSAEEKLDDEVRQLFCSSRAPVGGSVSIVELTVAKDEQRRATVRDLLFSEAVSDQRFQVELSSQSFGSSWDAASHSSVRPPTVGHADAAAVPELDVDAVAAAEERQEQRRRAKIYAAFQRDSCDQALLTESLKEVVGELCRRSRYEHFLLPPSQEASHRYWRDVSEPMDLATIMSRLDAREYPTGSLFMRDIRLIHRGAVEYYKELSTGASRAASLVNDALLLVQHHVDLDLLARCDIIARRGHAPAPPDVLVCPPEPSYRAPQLRNPTHGRSSAAALEPAEHNGHAGVPHNRHAASGNGGGKRASARLQGVTGDRSTLFDDPELLGRRSRLQARTAAQASQGEARMEDAQASHDTHLQGSGVACEAGAVVVGPAAAAAAAAPRADGGTCAGAVGTAALESRPPECSNKVGHPGASGSGEGGRLNESAVGSGMAAGCPAAANPVPAWDMSAEPEAVAAVAELVDLFVLVTKGWVVDDVQGLYRQLHGIAVLGRNSPQRLSVLREMRVLVQSQAVGHPARAVCEEYAL
ncbi:MAG: hypothetical protein WDW38_003878 [Sanguina aurantia]